MDIREPYLTEQNLQVTTHVLQALDREIERHFNNRDAGSSSSIPESEASALTDDFIGSTPDLILLMNGHGYRILTSLLANMCLKIERHDLAEVISESKETENQ